VITAAVHAAPSTPAVNWVIIIAAVLVIAATVSLLSKRRG
jgi:hypothetical protein